MPNNRIFFAVQQVMVAPNLTGVGSFTSDHAVHGLQSVGVNTRFNLEQIFEISQLAIYENIENLPDIEVTLEKVLDGYPLIYHLATPEATSGTLSGRSTQKCKVLLSLYDDTNDSASGTPIAEAEMSGMFVSQLQYQFPVEGSCTESVTLVGNNKIWRTSAMGSTGHFSGNNDSPIGSGGVNRREDVLFGSGTGYCVLPPSIRGITSVGGGSGYNIQTSGVFGAHIQSIRVSSNFGRDNMNELGRRGPYFRYINFPVEVTAEIEVYCTDGDRVQALEESENTTQECIRIKTREGTTVDLGLRNRLQSVSYGGANAGRQGGNATCSYSYSGFNSLTVSHPEDPAGL